MTFSPKKITPVPSHVAILSDSAWKQYFGGRSDILGHSIRLNDAAYTIVGVLPRDFYLVSKASDYQSRNRFDVWTPLALSSPPEAWQRGTHPLCVFARLKPGVSLGAGSGRSQSCRKESAASLSRRRQRGGITADPLGQHVVGGVRLVLWTLLITVAMVLLLACANIANLMLDARGDAEKGDCRAHCAGCQPQENCTATVD